MPREVKKYEIEIVAAGGTTLLDSRDGYDTYRIYSTGSVTLLANCAFASTGNTTSGTKFEFEYVANIDADGNTINFFGEAMPNEYTDKDCYITAYYNGSTWEVKYFVSLNESGIITPANLSISPYTAIDTILPTAGIASTATTSEETLATLTVPPNTLLADGDALLIIASGTTQANGNNKTIKLYAESVGTIVQNTTNTAPNNKDWSIRAVVTRNGTTDAEQCGEITISGSVTDIDRSDAANNYDWTAVETFSIKTTQGTATANNVILYNFSVYKLIG